jgi:hypothetical protein
MPCAEFSRPGVGALASFPANNTSRVGCPTHKQLRVLQHPQRKQQSARPTHLHVATLAKSPLPSVRALSTANGEFQAHTWGERLASPVATNPASVCAMNGRLLAQHPPSQSSLRAFPAPQCEHRIPPHKCAFPGGMETTLAQFLWPCATISPCWGPLGSRTGRETAHHFVP